MKIVRVEGPFGNLDTVTVFHDCGGDGIFNSDSFFLTISHGGVPVPIPREDVIVHFVKQISDENIAGPHTERAVTVDGVFLEISIHFVGVYIDKKIL
jgi:hypothetical protein